MKILVAGIGNIFLGDDGFGVEVARRLAGRNPPPAVRVADFGIRGFDLAYALLEGYDLTVLVDAAPRGGAPGTLYRIEPDLSPLENRQDPELGLDTHGMNPLKVLSLAKTMGGSLDRVVLIGCEPEPLEDCDEGRMGLSPAVSAAVPEAVAMVEQLIGGALEAAPADTGSRRNPERTG